MFICLECGSLFDEPAYWEETHGLDCGPYERWSGCPKCHSAYTETHPCNCCGEWIEGNYIKTYDGRRYCENCYTIHELGDEN